MMYELKDFGFTTAIGIGGDPVVGTTHIDALAAFEADPDTKAIVMIGEIGGDAEERAAAYIKDHVTKPVVGYVAGFTAPEGKTMGHAGAIVSGSSGTAAAKKEALEAVGVKVGKTPSETAALMREILQAPLSHRTPIRLRPPRGETRRDPQTNRCPPPLRTRFVHVVERRLGDPAEPGEAGVGDDLADGGLAGLGAEGVAAGLRHRVGHAEERREAVEHPAHGVQVRLDGVAGGGLDDQPRTVRGQGTPDVLRPRPSGSPMSCRQSNVVTRSRPVASSSWALATSNRTRSADPGVLGPLAGGLDGAGVVVRADEPAGRERVGHQQRRGAVAAAEVGDGGAALELGLDAVQRRDPLGQQVHQVPRAEEPLAAGEDVLVVLAPAVPGPGAERLLDVVLRLEGAERELVGARQEHRAGRVGQGERLLGRHRVRRGGGVVLDVAAGRLAAQPLVDVPRVGVGRGGHASGRRRAAGRGRGRGRAAHRAARCRHRWWRRGRRRTCRRTPSGCPCRRPGPRSSVFDGGHVRVSRAGASRVDAGGGTLLGSPLQAGCNGAAMTGVGEGEAACGHGNRTSRGTSSATACGSATRPSASRDGTHDHPTVVFVPIDVDRAQPGVEGAGAVPGPALPRGHHRPARQRPVRPAHRPGGVRRHRVRRPTRSR